MRLITSGPTSTNYIINEDWVTGAIAGSYGWTATTSTGTVAMNTANIDGTRWGLVALTSGTASGNAALISTGAANRLAPGTASINVEMEINLSALSVEGSSNYRFRAGLMDTWTGLSANGIWFDYDTTSSVNWRMSTANGASRTQTASSTAVATGWLKLVLEIGTSSVEYFVNDVSIGTVSSNFPTAQPMWAGIGITKGATGASNTTVLIDWFKIKATWPNGR